MGSLSVLVGVLEVSNSRRFYELSLSWSYLSNENITA